MGGRLSRYFTQLKKAMPVSLDTTGIILLSSSAMVWWGTAAGLAAAGVGLLVLNRVHNGS